MLFSNLVLIFWDWDELKIIFNLTAALEKKLEKRVVWEITGILLFLFTVFYRVLVDKYHLGFWFLGCMIIGLVGLIFGLRKRKHYKL
ncbi:hypothetical protein [Ascidiimonas sp. W6]|uniref:hypothetical protein n=1 Tax=Ascidiimonas meishanensis TaxID=3128903 RepID=UPI0030ED0AC5